MVAIFVLTAQLTKAQIECDSVYFIQTNFDTIEFKIKTYNCDARDYIVDFYSYTIPDKLEIWDTKADTFIMGDTWLPISNFPAPPGEPVIDGPAIITPDGIALTPFVNVPFDTMNAGSEGLARYLLPQAEYDSLTIKVIGNEDPQTAFSFISYCIPPPDYVHQVVFFDTLICNGQTGADTLYQSGLCADTMFISNYTDGGIELDDYELEICYGLEVVPEPLHDTIQYPDYYINTEPIQITDVINIEYVVYDGFCSATGTITYEPIYYVVAGDTTIIAEYGEQIEVGLCGYEEVYTDLELLYGCVYGGQVYEDATYEAQMYNGEGCVYTYTIDVEVYEQIYIPNAFTPNGDGNNDIFYAQMGDNVISYELQVYDRWGAKVFEGQSEWNGQHNGVDVNSGVFVYIYTFVFDNGKVLTIKGDVTVVR